MDDMSTPNFLAFVHAALFAGDDEKAFAEFNKIKFNEQKPKTDLREQISAFSRKYPTYGIDTRMFSDLLISKYPKWMQQAYKEQIITMGYKPGVNYLKYC